MMSRLLFFPLVLLLLQSFTLAAITEDVPEPAQEQSEVSTLAVSVQASFPASEVFGIKLINGEATQALVSFTNEEPSPVTVHFIGGSLWTLHDEGSSIIRNLTTTKYNDEIPPGRKQTLPFNLKTEMHPQDLRLSLYSIVSNTKGQYFTVRAFDGVVGVVEPDTSIFDPQIIFLYFFILTCFAGILYLFYTVWIAPYFPHKRLGKAGKTSGAQKKADSSDASPSTAASTTYNTEWIPVHHINRPEPRKVKGTSRSKSRT